MNSESASNIAIWKQLQAEGYFRTHPCYSGGTKDTGWMDVETFEGMLLDRLKSDGVLAVIGCGYGRESKHFAKRVERVYGIDLLPTTLQWAVKFVSSPRFIPVLARDYKLNVPAVDYAYSHSVFQHIPHELTIDYIETFKAKLKPGGSMVVQFVQHDGPDQAQAMPEPVYSWSREELKQLFGERAVIHTVPLKHQQAHYVYYEHYRA